MVPPGHFAGASYRDDSPRDFGPQIAYACWRWFQAVFRYPCPRQGHFAGASYRDDSPRGFDPQIAYACWRWFQAVFRYPCPRQGSEGGGSRPLDHMRQIPFVRRTLVPPY